MYREIIWQHISCRATQSELPEGQEKPHWGALSCNPSAHCFTAGSISIFNSQLLLRIRKKHRFRGAFNLSIKSIYRFYFSCGSTHKIEFAQQIHNSRGRGPGHPLLPLCGNSPCVPRELYKGRKIVPVGRGFSSRFDRKRGFDREAARKTIVFRQPQSTAFAVLFAFL